ncbi:MAG TPA: FtsX-like permease family protein, partial [Verrucomicrobiae bacterium]|nr:FtsX-like permease family protein [Verrucomicrobiae bacterium]
RTTLTVGALAIGLAMVVAVGGVAHESRLAASAWLSEVIPGDELLTSIRPIALDEDVIADLAAIDGVARVSPFAVFEVARNGVRMDAAAVVGADLLADGRLNFIDGDRAAALKGLDDGGVAVLPRSIAERTGLTVGSTLTLAVGEGKVIDLRVAGITDRTIPGGAGEAILVGWPDATAAFGVQGADVLAVRFAPGQAGAARPRLEEAARLAALEPNPLESVAGAVDSALAQVFGLFDALALVAVVVAALGIVNTLTVSVLERVRELGVLRAAGMTRGQVRRTVVVEAGILGIVGSVLGIVTGLVAGAILVLLAGGGRPSLELPWTSIGVALVLGVGISMAAAWYPARLASRLAIVAAVQHE